MTSDGATTAVVQETLRTGIEVAPLHAGSIGEFTDLFPISDAGPGRSGLSFIDGGRLAHSMVSGETQQLFVTDLASKASRAITTGEAHHNMRISRDGRVLVASRDEGAHKTVWRVDVETGREQRLTSGPFDEPQAVSRDGSWVVYASVGGENISLMKIPGSGGAPVTLLPQRTYCSSVSADDREALCLTFDAADKAQIVTVPLAGGAPRPIPGFPDDTRWVVFGPDARSYLYLLSRQGSGEIWSMPADGGKSRRLARLEGRRIGLLQVAPDGSRLAVVTQARSGDVVLLTRSQ
jgi:Tol biopolymer transport system component